jgi:hypothetical protein
MDLGDVYTDAKGRVWTIKDGVVDIDKIDAEGSPSSSNFLRGDGVWAEPLSGSGLTQQQVEGLL